MAASIAVVTVAIASVVIVALLRDGGDDQAEPEVSGTTTTIALNESPVGTPLEQVPVVVANGSGVSGAAGFFTEQLRTAGFTSVGQPTNVIGVNFPLDTVFYVDDGTKSWQAEAEAVATALGLDPAQVVFPLDPAAPPADIGNSTVLLVVGVAGILSTQVT